MKKSTLLIALVVVASFALGAFFYPQLPDQVASHWNAQGEVDGYMGKFWGTFLMPLLMAGIFVFFLLAPRIDPLKHNIPKFQGSFELLFVFLSLFFFYIYILILLSNLGFAIPMLQLLTPAITALLYAVGMVMQRTKRNWFIGIRTPWTLSSDEVWNKTHALGSKLFRAAALLTLGGIFFPSYALGFILVPILTAALTSIVYSYLVYRNLPNTP